MANWRSLYFNANEKTEADQEYLKKAIRNVVGIDGWDICDSGSWIGMSIYAANCCPSLVDDMLSMMVQVADQMKEDKNPETYMATASHHHAPFARFRVSAGSVVWDKEIEITYTYHEIWEGEWDSFPEYHDIPKNIILYPDELCQAPLREPDIMEQIKMP